MVRILPQSPLVTAPSRIEPFVWREIRESPLRMHEKFLHQIFNIILIIKSGGNATFYYAFKTIKYLLCDMAKFYYFAGWSLPSSMWSMKKPCFALQRGHSSGADLVVPS